MTRHASSNIWALHHHPCHNPSTAPMTMSSTPDIPLISPWGYWSDATTARVQWQARRGYQRSLSSAQGVAGDGRSPSTRQTRSRCWVGRGLSRWSIHSECTPSRTSRSAGRIPLHMCLLRRMPRPHISLPRVGNQGQSDPGPLTQGQVGVPLIIPILIPMVCCIGRAHSRPYPRLFQRHHHRLWYPLHLHHLQ